MIKAPASLKLKYVDAPEQYKEFIFDREMLIGAWADSLVPVMGEIGVRFMRIDTPSCEVLIRKKEGKNG